MMTSTMQILDLMGETPKTSRQEENKPSNLTAPEQVPSPNLQDVLNLCLNPENSFKNQPPKS